MRADAAKSVLQAYLCTDMIVWTHISPLFLLAPLRPPYPPSSSHSPFFPSVYANLPSSQLPNFLLGASTLFPILRSDTLFALPSLATRILFYLVLLFS
ncbi:hypothetical protein B0H19DRAFT_77812 [Mycena capillaripes]|nr:hypothetical protein B0H19DRAFT_77812 [Mycena capillaripes]